MVDDRIGNWGRWGEDDEAGALNLVTPAEVCRAVGLVRSGRVVPLHQPAGPPAMSAPHRRKSARFMDRVAGDYTSRAQSQHSFRFAEDTVQFPSHSGTHLDALSHVWRGDTLYNRHPATSIRSARGATRCGAEHLRPIVTRGVLIDVARYAADRLEGGDHVALRALTDVLARTDTQIGSGDVVLIRTGWFEQNADSTAYHAAEPGIGLEEAEWLAARDVSIVGSDNYAIEQQPSPAGPAFPVHLCLIHRYGVPLLENLDLSQLSDALASEQRAEFLVVIAPLPLSGSTAGPVAPVAVL